ncbi:uncharacterized protein EV420DRAFT_808597 [Desarmillaria tabescens]|uniref:Fe2OG dioxygenase domain-containing protein n=1 Tax=Armillaria tabescens TaxID=1929756 RepID=A0AA39NI40_ARMTA|nr:uncharacterized protein EV420DRAFT_808597 [Desarmillaria tabescens]KAK0466060.1 hypothetical protein EV420DRAFT_808597 [Desarmillaria tabescens]
MILISILMRRPSCRIRSVRPSHVIARINYASDIFQLGHQPLTFVTLRHNYHVVSKRLRSIEPHFSRACRWPSPNYFSSFSKAMSYFMLSGNYACSETFRQTPTPNLVVDGIGPISLPLSTRDARLIISNASRAPYGHNQQTIVNTSVRDTWEINAARITFRNLSWQTFVQGTVLPSVLQKLGMQVTAPRCELHKLLLYQEGSHFARHQDTARTPGMFATIVIILPSRYEGGAVEVSHAGSSRSLTFDFASQSQTSTTVLAWYSDVHHEIQRVTSGYRLALTYNVIRPPSRGTVEPLPSVPDVLTFAVDNLRSILQRWAELPNRRRTFFAYMLSHQYSIDDLEDDGIQALKGDDKHKVGYARDIAEQLGYRSIGRRSAQVQAQAG